MRTPLCDLLGIEAPVIQASIGPWSSAELTAAACEAGALGSVGAATRSAAQVIDEVERVRRLTDRPFAVNHTARPLDDEAWRATLEARPKVISFAIGMLGRLVDEAHAAGAVFVQQVHTVEQAATAAELGADVIIAQGGEAGGFSGSVGTLVLVPQVVDAVDPVPVVAAGGIADGRGLAAALALGAQGVNIGTRFLACAEAGLPRAWQDAIVGAASEGAVKVEFAGAVFPPLGPGGFNTLPRTLRTDFVDRWNAAPQEAAAAAEQLRDELMGAVSEGRAHELVPFTGQTAGMIDEVLPAREIVRRMLDEAEEALARASGLP